MLLVSHVKPNVRTDMQSHMQGVLDSWHVSCFSLKHTDINSPVILQACQYLTVQSSQKNSLSIKFDKQIQARIPVSIHFSLAWKAAVDGLVGTRANFLIINTQQRQCTKATAGWKQLLPICISSIKCFVLPHTAKQARCLLIMHIHSLAQPLQRLKSHMKQITGLYIWITCGATENFFDP